MLAYASDPKFFDKFLTEDDFKSFVYRENAIYHNMDIDNVTKFYLNGVDLHDPEAVKWSLYRFYGDIVHTCPTYLFAKRYAQHQTDRSKLFFYELTKAMDGTPKELGAYHSAELPLVFGLPFLDPTHTTRVDKEFSAQLMHYWVHFAKHG